MRVRLIDYILSDGGGSRFIGQLVQALQQKGGISELTLVSHGDALNRYRKLFADHGIVARFLDVPHGPRLLREHVAGFYPVAAQVADDCDVAWFPWFHNHRLPFQGRANIAASFHDGIMFTEPKFLEAYPAVAQEECETVRLWLESPATMICSSRYWRGRLGEIFDSPPGRLFVVPLAGAHARKPAADRGQGQTWPWSARPYLICPANTSPHKNHEMLLEAFALARLDWPLVLTGAGADFDESRRRSALRRLLRSVAVMAGLRLPTRGRILRRHAKRLGLSIGRNLQPLGYLAADDYDFVLERAAALVMPTLGEGGGSFPVEEAVLAGVPVICSDIPVLREQMERIGAEALWFNPADPKALAACLKEAHANHAPLRAKARAQVARLTARRWDDVAEDYLAIFRGVARGAKSP